MAGGTCAILVRSTTEPPKSKKIDGPLKARMMVWRERPDGSIIGWGTRRAILGGGDEIEWINGAE
jgi:hypothetical protein